MAAYRFYDDLFANQGRLTEAYLLYAHRDRLRRGGVLVVGPNRVFLEYISQVLPSLGETSVSQSTVDDLLGLRFRIRGPCNGWCGAPTWSCATR